MPVFKSDFRLSIRNFRQRVTCKHAYNVNELGTYALRYHADLGLPPTHRAEALSGAFV